MKSPIIKHTCSRCGEVKYEQQRIICICPRCEEEDGKKVEMSVRKPDDRKEKDLNTK